MRRGPKRTEAKVAVCADDQSAPFVFAAAAAMLFSTTLALPTFAVLPVVASVALACAALVAVAARLTSFKDNRLLLGDLAGACALVGAAAAIFSGPAQIAQTFALFAQ